jgi:hypothetical protein
MRLFNSLSGFKNAKRAKNNYFLFLVYFRYFSGFIFKQIRVFELNQIRRLGWQPGPTGQST